MCVHEIENILRPLALAYFDLERVESGFNVLNTAMYACTDVHLTCREWLNLVEKTVGELIARRVVRDLKISLDEYFFLPVHATVQK